MTLKVPYLFKRGDALVFRRRVPPRLQKLADVSEWKLSLGKAGADQSALLLEVRALTEATDRALASLKRGEPCPSTLLQDVLDRLHPGRTQRAVPTVTEAAALYRHTRRLPELKKPEAIAVSQFVAFAGDVPLNKVRRASVRQWIEVLRERGQSDATIRRRLGSMSTIFSHAQDDTESVNNPFCRHRLSTRSEGYRAPFDEAHLSAIQQWLGGPNGAKSTGYIIRLLRVTGARPLEIGGLEAADLRLDAPIPHLIIRRNAQRSLKTAASERVVPLVEDGIVNAADLLKNVESGPLFPPTCWQTGSLSARLNKALRSAGVPKSSSLTAYSFRHTIAEALRTTDAPFDVQQAILGHAKTTITERYGAGRVALSRMQSALAGALTTYPAREEPRTGSEVREKSSKL
jgi:integrase